MSWIYPDIWEEHELATKVTVPHLLKNEQGYTWLIKTVSTAFTEVCGLHVYWIQSVTSAKCCFFRQSGSIDSHFRSFGPCPKTINLCIRGSNSVIENMEVLSVKIEWPWSCYWNENSGLSFILLAHQWPKAVVKTLIM